MEANVPPSNPEDYSWLLYGEKGVGKTSLAAQFPDVRAHFMFQINRRDIRTPIIPAPGEEPLNWLRFRQYLQLLREEPKPGRLVVDDLDLCARACLLYHSALLKVPTLNGLNDNGRGWDTMKTDWENTWAAILWSGWRVTFTSHARVRPKVIRGIARDDMKAAIKDGIVASETQPTCSGWAYDWSKMVCTFAAYYGWHGHRRVLYLRGGQRIHASSGGISDEHFLQKKGAPGSSSRAGEPYDFIDMGQSPAEAWKRLKLAWDNKLEGGFAETEEFFTPEESL